MTLPTIDEELVSLRTHADRADWLIRQPEGVIACYAASIRSRMEAAGFADAVPYLQARIAAVWSVRTAQGQLVNTVTMAVFYAEGMMREAARARDGGTN